MPRAPARHLLETTPKVLLAECGQILRAPYVMMVCQHETLQPLVPHLLNQVPGRNVAAWGKLTCVGMDFEEQAVLHPEETKVLNQSRISL